MPHLIAPQLIGLRSSDTYVPAGAIWFDGSSDYLSATLSSGNDDLLTVAFWWKNTLKQDVTFLNAETDNNNRWRFDTSSNRLQIYAVVGGVIRCSIITDAVYRDPSAWYHVVLIWDLSQSSGNRVKIYVNGVLQSLTLTVEPSNSYSYEINTAIQHEIGSREGTSLFNADYLSDFIFIDGMAYLNTDFGEFDANGQWVPIDPSGLTFGINGFWLDFANSADLGNDVSGNGNDWTLHSIDSANATNDRPADDAANDVGNLPTFDPLNAASAITLSDGNRTLYSSAIWTGAATTMIVPPDQPVVLAFKMTDSDHSGHYIGIGLVTEDISSSPNTGTKTDGWYITGTAMDKFYDGTYTSYGSTYTTGDILMMAVNQASAKVWWGIEGSWYASGDPATGTNAAFSTLPTNDRLYIYGFSAQATFEIVEYPFAPPSGFKTLQTANLNSPDVADSEAYYGTLLYTGDNTTGRSITGLANGNGTAWTPDFVWLKCRSGARDHRLYDVIRGGDNALSSNLQAPETTGGLQSFISGGFTIDQDGLDYNVSGNTYVAWCMKAGGSGSSNTDGSITSTVSVAAHGGFSIVGVASGTNASGTIGHGLSGPVDLIISKPVDFTQQWPVWYRGFTSADRHMFLSDSQGESGVSTYFSSTASDDTLIRLGAATAWNNELIFYCFTRISGAIAVGQYTGNGSTDGPSVVVDDGGVGFSPAFTMWKRMDTTGNWVMHDSARNPYNPLDDYLLADDAAMEASPDDVDYLANGFKIRNTNASTNASGGTYIYLAFAEYPFGGSGVAQGKAR